jgi:hypothetical protein
VNEKKRKRREEGKKVGLFEKFDDDVAGFDGDVDEFREHGISFW